MSNVHLRNLCINLGGQEIIKDLGLDVTEGEFLVLLGPSGCGKSTLLHSIAGLIDVTSGTVEIGGRDMTEADPSERGIGMVFQSYALYPSMTVEKNMSFGLRMARLPKAQIEQRIARAAEMLHLQPVLKRKPAQLSGGQRQRVAIGRALVREAGVFLFDEPLSNLDAKLRAELRRELKLLHQKLRSTMIYVTHDQVEAMTLATRIVVMLAGKIQQIGAPAEVYDKPANRFVAGFLGAPAMNFIEGVLNAQGRFTATAFSIDVGPGSTETKCDADRAAVLGIRPEHIRIEAGAPLTGSVSLVEPMGNHQVVWIACGAHLLSALVHDGRSFVLGEEVSFAIDSSRVSLFDQTSGMRL